MAEKDSKQAVLVIHGVGEQRPMATLRGFVETVWKGDRSVQREYGPDRDASWSKPDTISGSYELRRLTTPSNRAGVRTDFFELYWAHRMGDTQWSHLVDWLKGLLLRSPFGLPRRLLGAWVLLVVMLLVVVFFAVNAALPEAERWIEWPWWVSGLVSLFTAVVAAPLMKSFVGDAARYLNPAPSNVKRRQEIRTQGVEVLKKLHDAGYDRIVVVGHSLGSVIGYDVLTFAWALYNQQPTERRGPHAALDALEAQVNRGGPLDLDEWRKGQRRYRDELREIGCGWRVTDFVTLGSPLTHAQALMAKDEEDLRQRKTDRELPTCPPVLEGEHFSYPARNVNRTPHHAALFAPTRWTNLYFPSRFIVRGDFIGGPLREVFGEGIRDVPVTTKKWGGFFSHTFYWDAAKGEADPAHVVALRKAVDLLDAEEVGEEEETSR